MLDLSLLRILKYRKDFTKLANRVPASAMDAQTDVFIKDFKKYFDKFPDASSVDIETFLPLFRAWHSGLKDEQRQAAEQVLRDVRKDVSPEVRSEIMKSLLELRVATELANLSMRFNEGNVYSIHREVSKIVSAFESDLEVANISYIDTDIDDLLDESADLNGVKFRLNALNRSMRPMQPGDLGIIAGRPDKGKTSLVASECTYWAPQLPADKNIVWLNNEGHGKRIIPRLYQAALGVNRTRLLELKQKGVLKAAYTHVMGRLNRIRVIDVHGMDVTSVSSLIEANNAGIVIYDMLDNVRGFGNGSGQRTDQLLEEMYQWAREFAVLKDHIAIATSQISAEGDNLQYPTLGMLKDSKTGKQGACDWQLMIGSMNDPASAMTRWLGLPKNKLRRDDGPADPRCAVAFSGATARFTDMEDLPDATE